MTRLRLPVRAERSPTSEDVPPASARRESPRSADLHAEAAPIKRCACGATYTEAQWAALPDAKVYRREHVGESLEVYDQRQCACGSHIVRRVLPEALADGEHIGTVVGMGFEPIRVDITGGAVVVTRAAGDVEILTPDHAEHLAELLAKAARLAE